MARIPRMAALREWPRSAWALLAANLVPLAGVLFFGWDLGAVMVLFWAENAVIGVYHAIKLALVTRWFALFLVPFFSFHYGLFTLVHGVFVLTLFVHGWDGSAGDGSAEPGRSVAALAWLVLPGLAALVASHGYSFVVNFLKGGELARMRGALGSIKFTRTGPDTWSGDVAPEDLADPERIRGFTDSRELMFAPYRRIVVLHLTIIGGAFLLILLRTPTPAILLLVAIKTIVDLRAHRKERARHRPPGQSAQEASPASEPHG